MERALVYEKSVKQTKIYVNIVKIKYNIYNCLNLLLQWLDVININMSIANRMDKIAWFQASNMSNHVRQQSIAGNIERNTQTHIGGPLIQLTRKFTISNVELDKTILSTFKWNMY